MDAESSVLASPGAREGSAETPVGSIAEGSLREAGWIAGGLIRRSWGPCDARAVLDSRGSSSHNGSSGQTGQDGEGLHDGSLRVLIVSFLWA